MIGKIIKWLLILFILLFIINHFGLTEYVEGQQQDEFKDNIAHTAIEGYCASPETTFNFDISSRILHQNITLKLYSERDNSTYEVQAGSFEDEGNFSYRKELNFELEKGSKQFNIVIDSIQYQFKRIITDEAMPSEYRKEMEGSPEYHESDIQSARRAAWFKTLIGVGITMPVSYTIAKTLKEYNITEVIK
ncbi:MAG: hypothetical protein ACLFT7_08690 [Thermoplasmata archaeon]